MPLFKRRGNRRGSSGYSLIGDRLTIRGEIDTDGVVRIEGKVEGGVHRAGTLIVGSGGTVIGDVEAGEVIVAGTVEGNVHASVRIEIEVGAAVRGEIRATAITLHEGAIIHGHVSIGAAPLPVPVAASSGGRHLELAGTPPQPGRARV